MVVYAIFASVSIGKLFMAGIIPGLILTLFFLLAIYLWAKVAPSLGPASIKSKWRERIISLKGIWPVIILIILVLGGMMVGLFSVTEAAGIGAFGCLIIAIIMRKLSIKNITNSLNSTVKTTAMIFVILIGAMVFNYFIVLSGMPIQLSEAINSLSVPPVGILIAILLVYLILGCIMDTMAMTVLTLPIFLPILSNLGFDLIWFGIIFVVMGEFALITPPIGLNVFIIAGMVKEVPMYSLFKGIIPFLISLILLLVILIAFPQVALFLTHISAAK
jgi:tripartite ATP-independent transporter DctM subunit